MSALPSRIVLLRLPGVDGDVMANGGLRSLGTDPTSPLRVLSAHQRGTVWWWRLSCRIDHISTSKPDLAKPDSTEGAAAAVDDASGTAAVIFHMIGVPDYPSTSPFTAVNYYRSTDAAVTLCGSHMRYEDCATEGARIAMCAALPPVASSAQAPRTQPRANDDFGPTRVVVVGNSDQTGPLLSELRRRNVGASNDADAVAPVKLLATQPTVGSVVEHLERALLLLMQRASPAFTEPSAPSASVPTIASALDDSFRGVILDRFPKARVYVVRVVRGTLRVGDTVLCSSNANESVARVAGMRCLTTQAPVDTASTGTIITVATDGDFYAAPQEFAAKCFDVLCAATTSALLPSYYVTVRLIPVSPSDTAPSTFVDRVLVQGLGGTSCGWVIGHRTANPRELVIAMSPYGTVMHAVPGARVVLCNRIPKHQTGETADMLLSGEVVAARHVLSLLRDVWAAAEPTPSLVDRFLTEHNVATSVNVPFTFRSDARFWLGLAVSRQLLTPVGHKLATVLRGAGPHRLVRWRPPLPPLLPPSTSPPLPNATVAAAAPPAAATTETATVERSSLCLVTVLASQTHSTPIDTSAIARLLSAAVVTAPLELHDNLRSSDREPTVLYYLSASDEVMCSFPPRHRYSYNVCPLPNELIHRQRLGTDLDPYPPPQVSVAANAWTIAQLTAISEIVTTAPVLEVSARFLDALVLARWISTDDWHLMVTLKLPSDPFACVALLSHPASHSVNLAGAMSSLFMSSQFPSWVALEVVLARPDPTEANGVKFMLDFVRRQRQQQQLPPTFALEERWRSEFVRGTKSIYAAAWFRLLRHVLRRFFPMDLLISFVLPYLVAM